MRIGVSARGLSVPIGGARQVVDHLLTSLPCVDPQHSFMAFQPEGTRCFPNVEPVWLPDIHPVLCENIALPRAVRRHMPDVFIAPKALVPPGIPSSVHVVSVVHDLLYFHIPGMKYIHEYKLADILYMRLRFRASCRRADTIFCVSENTKRDLLALMPECADKTFVMLNGVDVPDPALLTDSTQKCVQEKHGLARPYIFYAGTLSPRKNMVRGVQAWAQLADKLQCDLVVTAGKSWRDREVIEEVRKTGMTSRFHRLGAVSQDDIYALYAAAECMFFPSIYEGFGLPVLEAMACGCPVVASNASSIPEVAGEAALLVDPYCVDGMREALKNVLTESKTAEALVQAGYQRVKQFSWQKTAGTVISVLEQRVKK